MDYDLHDHRLRHEFTATILWEARGIMLAKPAEEHRFPRFQPSTAECFSSDVRFQDSFGDAFPVTSTGLPLAVAWARYCFCPMQAWRSQMPETRQKYSGGAPLGSITR